VVQCQDERSQIKNYAKALAVLRTRLYEMEINKKNSADAAKRKTLVAGGDRSEKIRTYNFPQSRITDHRIGYTAHNLETFMDGNIQDLLEALQLAENAERLKEGYSTAV
jgi:peptide chain release factor 1